MPPFGPTGMLTDIQAEQDVYCVSCEYRETVDGFRRPRKKCPNCGQKHTRTRLSHEWGFPGEDGVYGVLCPSCENRTFTLQITECDLHYPPAKQLVSDSVNVGYRRGVFIKVYQFGCPHRRCYNKYTSVDEIFLEGRNCPSHPKLLLVYEGWCFVVTSGVSYQHYAHKHS